MDRPEPHSPAEPSHRDDEEVEVEVSFGPGVGTSVLLLVAVGACATLVSHDAAIRTPLFVAFTAACALHVALLFSQGFTFRVSQSDAGFRGRTALATWAAAIAAAQLTGHGRTVGAAVVLLGTVALALAVSRLVERRPGHVAAPEFDVVEVHD